MRRWKLIWSIIAKYKILNLIYIFELIMAMVFVVILINTYMDSAFYSQIGHSFPYKGILYNRCSLTSEISEPETVNMLLEEMDGYLGMSKSIMDIKGVNGGNQFTIVSNDTYTSELFRHRVVKGKWYTQAEASEIPDGAIPCVLTDNAMGKYQIGDCITMESLSGSMAEHVSTPMVFYVTGFINRYTPFAVFSAEYEVRYNYLAHDIETMSHTGFSSGIGLLCGELPDDISVEMPLIVMLYFASSVSDSQLYEYYEILAQNGNAQILRLEEPAADGVATVSERTDMLLQNTMSLYFPYFILFMSYLILGFISISVYNAKILLKRFSVYYLVGLTKRGLAGIYGGYIMLLNLTALVPFSLILYYLNLQYEDFGDYTYQMNIYAALGVAAIVLVSSLLLLIPFITALRGYSPIALLNKE